MKTKNIVNKLEFDEYREKVRQFLTKVSDMRHPSIHIVYGLPTRLNENWVFEDIESFVDSYIEKIKHQDRHEYNEHAYFDPVLIINPKGEIFWIGTNNEEVNKLLKHLTKQNEGKLKKDVENKTDLITFINDDKELFSLSEGKVFLNFNKNAPIDYLGNVIKLKIKEISYIFEKDKIASLTPNLMLTKGWFPFNIITENLNETILALYSLWIENRINILEKHFPQQIKFALKNKKELLKYEVDTELDIIQRQLLQYDIKILVESEADKELGNRFLRLLDITESHNYLKVLTDEFDFKKPRRLQIFDSSDYVIILCSLVSSGETLRRMIKSVLRSNATPLTVLSLIDISGSTQLENKVTVWGNEVYYFSKFKDNQLIISGKNVIKSIEYRSPVWIEEDITYKSERKFEIQNPLREMIIKSEALHFNHVGKPNARHFTFYFNAHRFLTFENYEFSYIENLWEKYFPDENKNTNDYEAFQNLIWRLFMQEKIVENIKDWKSMECTEIWYPDNDYSKGFQKEGEDIAYIIKNGLSIDYKTQFELKAIPRDESIIENPNNKCGTFLAKNIIVTDWGSLTLETIEKLILKAHTYNINRVKNLKDFDKIKTLINNSVVENNLLICIFINQIPISKYNYIKEISDLKTNIEIEYEVGKTNLFDGYIEKLFIEVISKLRVVFFNEFPLSCFESEYECDVCAAIRDLNDYSFPGTALHEHVVSRKKALNIRPRETTIKKPFDFYSTMNVDIHLNANFIMNMFEFKNLLELALNSTYYRYIVQNKLIKILNKIINYYENYKLLENNTIWDALKEESNELLDGQGKTLHFTNEVDLQINNPLSEISSIIYFLSIETSWLQKPPLSLIQIRKILKIISKSIIFNGKLNIINENREKDENVIRIKYAAITVLRMVDKSEFINHLHDIVQNIHSNNIYSNSILENIFFHTNTFISKEYHEQHKDLDGLIKTFDSFNKLEIEKLETSRLVKESVFTLKRKASNLIIKGEIRALSNLELIKKCKSDIENGNERIDYKHPVLIQNIRDLELKTKKIPEYFKHIYYSHWNYISNYIRNIIGLPFKGLNDLFNLGWANNYGSYYLTSYLSTYIIGYNDPFSIIISRIKETNFKCFEDELFLNEYITEYNRIIEYFISHPRFDNKSSLIYQILKAINGNLKDSYEYAKKRHSETSLISEIKGISDVNIFYPQDLLNSLFYHLFQNGKEKAIIGKAPKMTINIENNDPSNSSIVLFIEYENTDRNINKGKGTGLREHKNYLSKFNGELTDNLENADETFNVTIKFIKYE